VEGEKREGKGSWCTALVVAVSLGRRPNLYCQVKGIGAQHKQACTFSWEGEKEENRGKARALKGNLVWVGWDPSGRVFEEC